MLVASLPGIWKMVECFYRRCSQGLTVKYEERFTMSDCNMEKHALHAGSEGIGSEILQRASMEKAASQSTDFLCHWKDRS